MIEHSIVKLLRENGEVQRLVVNRVSPHWIKQGEPLPAVTYTRIDTERSWSLTNRMNLDRALFQLTCWAENHDQALTLAQAVRRAIDGFRGVLGSHLVSKAWIDGDTDIGVPPEAAKASGICGVSLDLEIWYREEIAAGV